MTDIKDIKKYIKENVKFFNRGVYKVGKLEYKRRHVQLMGADEKEVVKALAHWLMPKWQPVYKEKK